LWGYLLWGCFALRRPIAIGKVSSVSSVCLDRESRSMTTRWFLNLNKPAERALNDLHAVQLMSHGCHYVSLVFHASSPARVVLATFITKRKAKGFAQILGDYLGVPLLEQQYEIPGTPKATLVGKVWAALAIIMMLIGGVIGAVAGEINQIGPGFLKDLPANTLIKVRVALGFLLGSMGGCFGSIALLIFTALIWGTIKAITQETRKTRTPGERNE
jgi:hypothetical protein